MEPSATVSWVRIARLGRPHGVRGALRAYTLDSEPLPLWLPGPVLAEWETRGGDVERKVETHLDGVHPGPRGGTAVLRGLSDRESASAWTGAWLAVERSRVPRLDETSFYLFELLGVALHHDDQTPVGRIRGFEHAGSLWWLQIQLPTGAERLVPMERTWVVSFSRDHQVLTMRLPEGLLTLDETKS